MDSGETLGDAKAAFSVEFDVGEIAGDFGGGNVEEDAGAEGGVIRVVEVEFDQEGESVIGAEEIGSVLILGEVVGCAALGVGDIGASGKATG